MRFIIYSLILANVAFYAWHVYNPGPAPQTGYHPPTFPAGVKTLVLLNEGQEQGGEAPTGNAGSKAASGSGDTNPPGAPANAPSPGDTGQASPANNAASATPAPAHSDAAAPSAPKSGNDGTPDGSTTSPRRSPQGSSVRNDGPATDATAGSGSTASCYRIGPLSDAAAAAALSTRLAQQGLNATVDKVRTKQPDGYWVFLPPMSHDEAVGISEDLSSKGIKDYFIGKDNYISLGIFNGPQSAEQRRQQIADMGYAPKVEKHFTTQEQYWLAVKLDAGMTVSGAKWKALLSSVPAVQREPSSCE
ncbi:MAG TPA: hypothetical protein VKA76_12805 [Gammaproteobacteria bacterium]|nr:hypothetical protein [Gammaproteobacteria bacterium]